VTVFLRLSWFSSTASGKRREITSDDTITTSFHALSISAPIYYLINLRYVG
jgi:hypothetical protein